MLKNPTYERTFRFNLRHFRRVELVEGEQELEVVLPIQSGAIFDREFVEHLNCQIGLRHADVVLADAEQAVLENVVARLLVTK